MKKFLCLILIVAFLFNISFVLAVSNPSAKNCIGKGFEYEVRTDEKGNEYGVCIFSNDEEVSAWDFYEDTYTKEISKDSLKTNSISVKENKYLPEQRQAFYEENEKRYSTSSFSIEEELPDSFDWRNYNSENWLTPIKSQSSCGSCWAFAAVSIAESTININLDDAEYNIDLSEQDLVSCSDAGNCDGGFESDALYYMKDEGIVRESCFGYTSTNNDCSNKCSNWENELVTLDYSAISASSDSIKDAIINYGPVTAYMVVCYDSFDGDGIYSHSGDVYWDDSCWSYDGEYWYLNWHAINLVGYDDTDEYWISRNSWGSNWGESGYFKIAYSESVYDYSAWADAIYNDPDGDSRTFFLDDSYKITSTDIDNDGVNDNTDNCPEDSNVDQANQDEDGVGDVCDTDYDNDGVDDADDNCPYLYNPEQSDEIDFESMDISEDTTLCDITYNILDGITVTESDITLDCNSATIKGDYTSSGSQETGIDISDLSSVTVKNCIVDDYFRAIKTFDSNNLLVEDNTFLPEQGNTALYIQNTYSSTIENNIINGTVYVLWDSYDNIFINNAHEQGIQSGTIIFSGVSEEGIGSHNNIVRNSLFSNMEDYGINLQHGSYGNTIENNIFNNNLRNILIAGSKDNILRNNTLNFVDYDGIRIGDPSSTGNIIYNNHISNAGRYCISIAETSDNIIYNNDFINCDIYDEDSTTWSSKTGGNYWDIFDEPEEGCFDNNADGLCDDPFIIDADSQDDYPFVDESGWLLYDICIPNWILDDDWSACQIDSFQYKYYTDTNECNLDDILPKMQECDYCTPDWVETEGECQEDDSLLISYVDSNECYGTTNLISDLEGKPEDYSESLNCDFDGDGFIGNITDIDSTINLIVDTEDNDLIIFSEGDQTILEVPKTTNINFGNVAIEKQNETASAGSLIISGLDLPEGQTKTVYIDNINQNASYMCIIDADEVTISQFTDNCDSDSEIRIACDGVDYDGYICVLDGEKYKVSGLTHSGIKEVKYIPPTPEPDPEPQPSSGGGGGGGGGGSYAGLTITDDHQNLQLNVGRGKSFALEESKHTITLDSISGQIAQVTIRSDPITITVKAGEEKTVDINSSFDYLLGVKAESVSGSTANILLRRVARTSTKATTFATASGEESTPTETPVEETEILDNGVSPITGAATGFAGRLGTRSYVGIAIGIIVLVAMIFLVKYKKIPLKSKKEKDEKPEAEEGNLDELRAYIEDQLSKGDSKRKIKSTLVKAGWSKDAIKNVFDDFNEA
jgi:parallel beta-helix repeat protein